MKKILLSAALLLAVVSTGCNHSSSSSESTASSNCVEPQNPYDEGTGHYAGWEWAAEHGGSCEGSSQSFNEGCEEYERQEAEFQECEAKARK